MKSPATLKIAVIRTFRMLTVLAIAISVAAFMAPEEKPTVYLIGDSTMSVKERKSWPETGWGMAFANFFDTTRIRIDNRAMNGRSTKSFLAENRWQPVVAQLKKGDFVLIQFGHNDESKDKGERYAPPEMFKDNLRRFVNETREKHAEPVLITPVSRRKFDKNGAALETHAEYTPLTRAVANELHVPLLELDSASLALYRQLGPEASRLLFLQLKPGEHPNYPAGKEDNTHFNELGARLIAQIVLANIRNLEPALAAFVIQPPVKK